MTSEKKQNIIIKKISDNANVEIKGSAHVCNESGLYASSDIPIGTAIAVLDSQKCQDLNPDKTDIAEHVGYNIFIPSNARGKKMKGNKK